MASRPTPDFSAFIARIARELASRQLPFMLIGGQAVLLHGQPRLTEDIDITLGVDPSQLHVLQKVCAALGREPLPEDVPAFVRDTFVLPARHPETAIRVDFIFSTTPYERQAIGRAVPVIPRSPAGLLFPALLRFLIPPRCPGSPTPRLIA